METIDKLYNMYKITKKPDKILDWLSNNLDEIDLLKPVYRNSCEIAIQYLFNEKLGNWTEVEVKFLIVFFIKQYTGKYWLERELNVSFLTKEEYTKRFGEKGIAIYVRNSSAEPCIYFSSKLLSNLQENNTILFLEGLRTVFHETIHAIQNAFLSGEVVGYFETEEFYDYKKYIMMQEILISKIDKNFYMNNYSHLLIENDANKEGIIEAGKILSTYNFSVYERLFKHLITTALAYYDKKMKERMEFIICGKKCSYTPETFDAICTAFLKQNPNVIKSFPILKLSHNDDGTKKDIIQLYNDRNEALNKCLNQEKCDELYEFIANRKSFKSGGLNEIKNEIQKLASYIKSSGEHDEFLKRLLLYRMNKLKWNKDAISEVFKLLEFDDVEQDETFGKEKGK